MRSIVAGRDVGLELTVIDLAHRGHRHLRDEFVGHGLDIFGQLLGAHPLQLPHHLLFLGRGVRLEHDVDEGQTALHMILVGAAHHRALMDSRVAADDIFDHRGEDLEAVVADDEALDAGVEEDEAVLIQIADVAGVHPDAAIGVAAEAVRLSVASEEVEVSEEAEVLAAAASEEEWAEAAVPAPGSKTRNNQIINFNKKTRNMKKSIIIILAVVAILVIWAVSVYNGLVTMDENVSGQWANVETQYQRRADLIPNLVNTVKGYATHEKETLEGVVAARSQATQIKVDAADLTPEKLAQYQKAQGAVTSALGKLLAITENYPDLKANQNFLELQAQLEGTENRINVARKNFNDAAQAYNTNIRRFPKNIFAGMFGFDKKAYFEAEEGSEKAPKVEF